MSNVLTITDVKDKSLEFFADNVGKDKRAKTKEEMQAYNRGLAEMWNFIKTLIEEEEKKYSPSFEFDFNINV